MSLKSWKKEFYSPIEKATKHNCHDYVLKKWRGLTMENLEKHGVAKTDLLNYIYDIKNESQFRIDGKSCAYCKLFECWGDENLECPISKEGDKFICDGRNENNPYRSWVNTGNPIRMIKLLEKIKEKNTL